MEILISKLLPVEGCSFIPGLSISSRPWLWQEANPLPLEVVLATAVGFLSLFFPLFSPSGGLWQPEESSQPSPHFPVVTHPFACPLKFKNRLYFKCVKSEMLALKYNCSMLHII